MTTDDRRHLLPDDAGLSLMEIVVAMAVMTGMVVATLGLMLNTLDGSRDNAQRVQAAGIVARQVEAVRGTAASAIPDGVVIPADSAVTIDGTSYTVQQSAVLLTGDGTSVCSSTDERPTYKRVTVTVTWPDMGSTAPVRSDTLVAVGLGATGPDSTKGTAAILVRNAQAAPLVGTTVTLLPSGQQRTTDADGCAVFSTLDPGAHTATVNRAGYVGLDGVQSASATVGVVAGRVRRATIDYDVAGALAVTLAAPSTGYDPPAGVALPVTLEMAQWSPTSRAFPDCATAGATPGSCVTSTPRTAARLFPASYTAWAGTCVSSRPSSTPARVQVQSSRTTGLTALLSGADVRVLARTGNGRVDGRTIYARNTTDAGCSAQTITVGTSASTDTKVALPQGTWTFTLNPDGSGGVQRTLVAGIVNATRVDLRVS